MVHTRTNVIEAAGRGASAVCDGGYVAVDAMMALLILAGAVTASLLAVHRAHDVTRAAEEVRNATAVARHLLETGPATYEVSRGRAAGFDWSLETQVSGLERPIAICRRAVRVTARDTGRVFAASTRAICPASTPA